MEKRLFFNNFTVKIGIAIKTAMFTSIISTDVDTLDTATFFSLIFVLLY